MKKKFSKEYVMSNRGCYNREQVDKLPFDKSGNITIAKLHKVLPINDFSWFIVRKCEMTVTQQRQFALHCAKQVLPIFEAKNPNDNRVRVCIEVTEGYLKGTQTRERLSEVRRDAYAAAAAYADAADAAAYAYAAAAADAAYAAYAAAAAYADAAAAAAAAYAYAAAAAAYSKSILQFVKQLS